MDQERNFSGNKYLISPKTSKFDFKNLKTPQIKPKNETSEMILSQTKESLHNFIENLKKTSILKQNTENRHINTISKISGLSNLSNIKNPEEVQEFYISPNINKLKRANDNNNLEANILNYNKIYNTNNVYNLGNNSSIKNRARIRLNKQIEPLQHEKINTENNLNLLVDNNLYNTFNTTNKKADYSLSNSARRIKYNFSTGKDIDKEIEKSEERSKNLTKNLLEKIKSIKSENLLNKKDILNLSNAFNEMQNSLLNEMTKIIKEKDNKIKELGNQIKDFKLKEQKGNEIILEKNKKLMQDVESLNN